MTDIVNAIPAFSCYANSFVVLGANYEVHETGFAHEVADHLAASAPVNCKVLYFSANESKHALEHGSTNRLWFEKRLEQRITGQYEYNTNGYDDIKKFPVGKYQEEVENYKDSVRGRIQVFAGDEPYTVETIKCHVQKCAEGGRRPVVIIDSIQGLVQAPSTVDDVLCTLKAIQKQYGILAIAVCTMSGEYYQLPVELRQFDDAETIQKYADWIWGLEVAETSVVQKSIPGKYSASEDPWLVNLKALKAPNDADPRIIQVEYCAYYKCYVPYKPAK